MKKREIESELRAARFFAGFDPVPFTFSNTIIPQSTVMTKLTEKWKCRDLNPRLPVVW